jgi:hypothetical protein
MDLLAFAKSIAERLEAEASRTKVPAAVCVIDSHGNIILNSSVHAHGHNSALLPGGHDLAIVASSRISIRGN